VAAAIRLAWSRKRSADDRARCKSSDHSAGTRTAVVLIVTKPHKGLCCNIQADPSIEERPFVDD